MKHNTKFLILLFLITSCIGKNDQIENQLIDCLYSSYSDNGIEFKQTILDYEQYLISKGILTDRTGKGYRNIFTKIKKGNGADFSDLNFFFKKMSNLEKVNQSKKEIAQDCKTEILNNNNFKKGQKLNSHIKSFQKSQKKNPAVLAKNILETLKEKDFELDYYKLRTFFIIDILIKNTEHNSEKKKTIDLSNAFKIYLDQKNKIYVNDKETNVQNLEDQIIDYVDINKSKSIIILKADKESLYQNYIIVQNEIVGAYNFLRNQLSQKKFNMGYYKLNEIKKKEIDGIYPKNIITK